eukprot:1078425-Alexandrium_andersonii.AAC.1
MEVQERGNGDDEHTRAHSPQLHGARSEVGHYARPGSPGLGPTHEGNNLLLTQMACFFHRETERRAQRRIGSELLPGVG